MSDFWKNNWLKTRKLVKWVDIKDATAETYSRIGFKSGLEVHQQLKTEKKLFCRCKAGIYHDFDDFDAEVVRHMRPTLSELGEYDGTALMEFKTRKNIIYRIKNDSACTYEVDDTPPFKLNREALSHAMEIALLLKMNIVGELHITRKQYLDGSIPTGFQRTTILGIEGEIPIKSRKIRLIQFSIEEDSCREVSDYRHTRIYYADRLGMPLIETVTYPDMLTPHEVAEACQYIRFVARSSGKARIGIGAARQDVNVSVDGGTRVEIKGVSHISWIPKLTHNEAFRQVSLLEIKKELVKRNLNSENWKISSVEIPYLSLKHILVLKQYLQNDWKLIAVNLPGFKKILSFFTQPGRTFADEISDRLKVIACLEKPNMFHSEELEPILQEKDWNFIRSVLNSNKEDAQLIFWTDKDDLSTALETIEERLKIAFEGVPNETRKSLCDGTTVFERVLPGPDRMYPDTDSKPIAVTQDQIEAARDRLPVDLAVRLKQLKEWKVPEDAFTYLLRNNLMPIVENISEKFSIEHKKIALIFAHRLKNLQGDKPLPFNPEKISEMILFVKTEGLTFDIIYEMIPVLFDNPNMQFQSILTIINYQKNSKAQIVKEIPILQKMYQEIKLSKNQPVSGLNWMMGRLRNIALGNLPLKELKDIVVAEINREEKNA